MVLFIYKMAMAARGGHDAECVMSVILPVYNAMPWLPVAVRDMLKQVRCNAGIRFCRHAYAHVRTVFKHVCYSCFA